MCLVYKMVGGKTAQTLSFELALVEREKKSMITKTHCLSPSEPTLVTVVVASSLLGGFWGKARRFPTCAFFFFLTGDQLAHTNSTLYARIGPQWLSERRRLWPSVSRRVACEPVSLIDSHSMPGQHSQPTPTSLGRGCMRV